MAATQISSSSRTVQARSLRRHRASSFRARPVQRSCALTVRAEATGVPRVQPPVGVSVPTQLPQVPPPAFGFVNYAEKVNSRACMIGFFALLAVEAITGRGLLEIMGLSIGKGLPFSL